MNMEPCPKCSGKGHLDITYEKLYIVSGKGNTEMVKCSRCNATGEIPRMNVANIIEAYELPRPMAQAIFSHYKESEAGGLAYDWQKLCALLARARQDEENVS